MFCLFYWSCFFKPAAWWAPWTINVRFCVNTVMLVCLYVICCVCLVCPVSINKVILYKLGSSSNIHFVIWFADSTVIWEEFWGVEDIIVHYEKKLGRASWRCSYYEMYFQPHWCNCISNTWHYNKEVDLRGNGSASRYIPCTLSDSGRKKCYLPASCRLVSSEQKETSAGFPLLYY